MNLKDQMKKRAKEITNGWKEQHGEAMKRGNFSFADFIRRKLETWGQDGDSENLYDPEELSVKE